MSRSNPTHGDTREINRRLEIVRHLDPEEVAPYFAVERSQPNPSYGYNPHYLALTADLPPAPTPRSALTPTEAGVPTVVANPFPAPTPAPTPATPTPEKPATLSEIRALAETLGIGSLAPRGSTEPPLTTEAAETGLDRKTWLGLGLAGLVLLVAVFFIFRK